MARGFWREFSQDWVGMLPVTPKRQAEIDAANLAAVARQAALDAEARRPDTERVADLAEAILNTIDQDLVDAVRGTGRQLEDANV